MIMVRVVSRPKVDSADVAEGEVADRPEFALGLYEEHRGCRSRRLTFELRRPARHAALGRQRKMSLRPRGRPRVACLVGSPLERGVRRHFLPTALVRDSTTSFKLVSISKEDSAFRACSLGDEKITVVAAVTIRSFTLGSRVKSP